MHTVTEVIESCKKVYGFDPSYYYCSMTGKPLGYSFQLELQEVIESIPGDLEAVTDDLALRILASMRPSIKWNKLRTESLDDMRRSHPLETMAYLLNRLFENRESKRYDIIALHQDRIVLFDKLSKLDSEDIASPRFQKLMVMLLELEAKLGLLAEAAPFVAARLIEASDLLQSLEDALTPWHAARIKAWDKAQAEARFNAQNPGAKIAYYRAWMDQEPATPQQAKKQEKVKQQNVIGSLIDALLDPAAFAAKVETHKPEVFSAIREAAAAAQTHTVVKKSLPIAKAPARFGGFKKQEG